MVQSGPDPDFNRAAGKMSAFTRAEALGRWRGFGPLKHFCCPRNLTNGRMGHALVQFPFLPSPSSQVAAESSVGSGQCWCEKQGEWAYHQSGGSNFLFSGFCNPPTSPNPLIHSRMRICWCSYAYVHTHPQAEVSVCTQRSYVCIFFTCMPTCPLDSLSWGQPCFVPIGKFQTHCTPLLQSSISFT